MLTIPLQAIPSQQLLTTLNNQGVQINVYQKRYGLFLDFYVQGVLEIGGVICENLNRIIRSAYLNTETGFSGDLFFVDTQGSTDPYWAGLGARYLLYYATEAELAAFGLTGT